VEDKMSETTPEQFLHDINGMIEHINTMLMDKYKFIEEESLGRVRYRVESEGGALLCIEDTLKETFWALHYFHVGIMTTKRDTARYIGGKDLTYDTR
jgi:hypothetical protein